MSHARQMFTAALLSAGLVALLGALLFDVFGFTERVAEAEARQSTARVVCVTLTDARRRTDALVGLVKADGREDLRPLLVVSRLREQDLRNMARSLGTVCHED